MEAQIIRLCVLSDFSVRSITDQELVLAVEDWNSIRELDGQKPVSGTLTIKREFVLDYKDADGRAPKLSVSFLPTSEAEISDLESLGDYLQQRFNLPKKPAVGIAK